MHMTKLSKNVLKCIWFQILRSLHFLEFFRTLFQYPFGIKFRSVISLWILEILQHLRGEKWSSRVSLPEYAYFVCFPRIFVILRTILDLEGSKNAKKWKHSKSHEFLGHINDKPMKRHLIWSAEQNLIMLPNFGYYLSVYQPKLTKNGKN